MTAAASYLDGLNPEQRRAVEHGVGGQAALTGTNMGANVAPPLLIIAGAGSGKTNTLAHQVHQIG